MAYNLEQPGRPSIHADLQDLDCSSEEATLWHYFIDIL